MVQQKKFFELGDMLVYYITNNQGQVGFGMVPSDQKPEMVSSRIDFNGDAEIEQLPIEWRPTTPRNIFSLAQARVLGDASHEGPFGRSMLNGETSSDFKFVKQNLEEGNNTKRIVTQLEAKNGLVCIHKVIYSSESKRFIINTSYQNNSKNDITVELLSSFSISDLSPFDAICSHDRLYLHRFKTFWSREGRHVTDSINNLQMSPSWHVAHFANEKFGQIGSWSTNGWYPQMAIEDRKSGTMWGVRLACTSSWQMELFRYDDQLSIAGGLADYDSGHWKKKLAPGEEIVVPEAFITTCKGTIDELCSRLTEDEKSKEQKLPVMFNDWCTNWGVPSEESVKEQANILSTLSCDYFIIDAGWYKPDNGLWNSAHGDWNPNKKLYPKGLKNTADIIKSHGLKPGLWFEYETVGIDSEMYKKTEFLLHADGKPIQVGVRRFLDFRKPEVIRYLDEKVIKQLSEAGFGYIKIDYNSSIGKGADGNDSLGESLRVHLTEVIKYLQRIRDKIPGIIIENCASGGMRLDPLMMSQCNLGSFSDAHASPEIPVIAANLHRLIHPGKSLVWAVLRAGESLQRINYSLAATFLGRVCLSGDISLLNHEQIAVIQLHLQLYRKIQHLILEGTSQIFGDEIDNYREAKGCQIVARESSAKNEVLLVCHGFELNQTKKSVEIKLEGYENISGMISEDIQIEATAGSIQIHFNKSWVGAVFHLKKLNIKLIKR